MRQRGKQGKTRQKGHKITARKSSTACNSRRPPWGCSWFCLSDLKERQGTHAGKRLRTEELINKGWTSRQRKGRLKSSTFLWTRPLNKRYAKQQPATEASYGQQFLCHAWCKELMQNAIWNREEKKKINIFRVPKCLPAFGSILCTISCHSLWGFKEKPAKLFQLCGPVHVYSKSYCDQKGADS